MLIDDTVPVENQTTDDLRDLVVEDFKEYIDDADDDTLMFIVRRLGSNERRRFSAKNLDPHIAEWYRRVSAHQEERKV